MILELHVEPGSPRFEQVWSVSPAEQGAYHSRGLTAATKPHPDEVGEVVRLGCAPLGDRNTAFVCEGKRVDVVDRLFGVPSQHTLHHLDRQQSTVTSGDSAKEFDVDRVNGRAWSQRGRNLAQAPAQPEERADRLHVLRRDRG